MTLSLGMEPRLHGGRGEGVSALTTTPQLILWVIVSSETIACCLSKYPAGTKHRSLFYQCRKYPKLTLGLIKPKQKFLGLNLAFMNV